MVHIRGDDLGGFYKHLKGIDVEGKGTHSSHYRSTRDEEGGIVRNTGYFRVRWARWLHTLLNTKPPNLVLAAIGHLNV